jgi:hypothetical protein
MKMKFLNGKSTLLLFIVILLLIASSQPTLAGPEFPNLAIADGEWLGKLKAYYLWEVSEVEGVWTWGGDMHFFSTTGELTGESVITGVGSGESDQAFAIGTVNAQVAIFGSSDAPQFQATGGSLDFTATAMGFSTEVSIPIDASESIPVTVKIVSATCSQVGGHFDDFMNQYLASVGGSLQDLTTLFAAVRIADLDPAKAPTYQDELNDLVGQAVDFLEDAKKNSAIDQNAFQSILSRAEELAVSLRKNNDCGFTKEWSFALPIASLVAQLVEFAHQNPGQFSNFDLYLLTEAAVRTGALGAGAVNPDLDTEVNAKLSALIGQRLDALDSAGGDCTDLQPLFVAAFTLGGNVQTQASGLFTKFSC